MLGSERREHLFFRKLAGRARAPERAIQIVERFERVCLADSDEAGSVADDAAQEDRYAQLADRLRAEASRLAREAKLDWIKYARGQLETLAGKRAAE
jgi:hypothetical protein